MSYFDYTHLIFTQYFVRLFCSKIPRVCEAVLRLRAGGVEAGAQNSVPRKDAMDSDNAFRVPRMLSNPAFRYVAHIFFLESTLLAYSLS